jgi:7-cyano-7-deazaguanine reductase
MTIEATHLGRQSAYPQQYDPSVLVAVPRHLNREQYNIEEQNLPFEGIDVWHAYEFSFLTLKGAPVVGLLKITYPCNNKFLVESKSLKLYLNSFNMSKYGQTRSDGIDEATGIITRDLSQLLKCEVLVSLFDHSAQPAASDFDDYLILEELVDFDNISCTTYTETPELLKENTSGGEIKWGTHLLRSNCKITHQPDWGSLFISMKGEKIPTPESFLQYIVSLRNENHFHEEICEMVFKRLIDIFAPDELMITCMYTRRGGIDINPVRTMKNTVLPSNFVRSDILTTSTYRQ